MSNGEANTLNVSSGLVDVIVAAAKSLGINLNSEDLIRGIAPTGEQLTDQFLPELLSRSNLESDFFTLSIDDIPDDLSPVLLQLNDNQWAIWLGNKRVIAYGPEGQEVLSLSQLKQRYSGQAWVVYQPVNWQQTALPLADSTPWFRQLLGSQSWIYGYALLATMLINIFALVVPFFTMAVYDRVIPNNALTSLTALAFGASAILLFDFVTKNIRTYLIEAAGRRFDNRLGVAVYAKLIKLKNSARNQPAGQLAATIKDYETLRSFMSGTTMTLLGDLPFAFLFIAIIGVVAGPMWIWPMIGLVIIVGIGIALQIPLRKLVQESQKDSTEKNVLLYESLNGLDSLKALGAEDWSTQRWRQLVGINSLNQDKYRRWSGLSQHSATLIQLLVSIAIIVHGAILVAEGEVTSGVLIASMMLGSRAMGSSGQIANLLISYHQACLSYAVVNGVMQGESESKPVNETISKSRYKGKLSLQDVSVRYQPDAPEVLKELNLEIRAGERIGILGKVGSGKSTLLNVLMGLQQLETGRVLVDDLNLESLDKVQLRRNIGFMQQENHLFSASLRTNIALRDLTGDDETVIRAMRVIGLDEVIGQTAQGLDLPIGERGNSLSGGQRQLVCLARAFYNSPSIMLLDEPTSLLDNSSEQRVLQGMAGAVKNKTLVLVTHRPKLLALVDRLIVLDGGRIVADGPKDQVLNALSYQDNTGANS
ncbi:type I secretion system permease/ATPase [Amphritea balenae]|uniref:Type I secretion system permease/ATPase n=1 Tax=Amphritea balenae TaxID=452629 RepID=A0A3P1STY6_9GAMM|nr:type I secretion system permease/ATPase [Amphritea balenae]RRD00016.1 type I secretion system permease/ATPase [Amphritea balenae]GGK75881.1 ABC transporter [Amphritea balenae]